MRNLIKVLLSIIIVIYIILIILEILFRGGASCIIFKKKVKTNKFAGMIREIQLKADCNINPTIPINKYIYIDNKIYGAISGTTLIFRGTDRIYELFLEGLLYKDNFIGINIQKGLSFLIKKIIPQIESENIKTVTGWSLGAQLAILTSLYFYKKKHIKLKTIVFGLPVVGGKQLKKEYKPLRSNTKCINNPHDKVIKLPFLKNNLNKPFYNYLDLDIPVKCSDNYLFHKRKLFGIELVHNSYL